MLRKVFFCLDLVTGKKYIALRFDAGWSSLVARRAHNPKVGGSNPSPATKKHNASYV